MSTECFKMISLIFSIFIVTEVKDNFRKYDINHQHLKQCVAIAERNSSELKRELISTR